MSHDATVLQTPSARRVSDQGDSTAMQHGHTGGLGRCMSEVHLTVVALEASPAQYSCFRALRTSVADAMVELSEEIPDMMEFMLFERLLSAPRSCESLRRSKKDVMRL